MLTCVRTVSQFAEIVVRIEPGAEQMDTLKIAFDTVIIGALALPWMLLLLDLFLQSDGQDYAADQIVVSVRRTLGFINEERLTTLAAVLLFAMAYAMGAGIMRLGGDFLNDDDFAVFEAIKKHVPTKDRIHYQVYCNASQGWLVDPCPCVKYELGKNCMLGDLFNLPPSQAGDAILVRARRFFELQEGALLNEGGNVPGRMSHIYQQLVILRGAVLDGVVLTLLMLFCWIAGVWGKRAVAVSCAVFLVWASAALCSHLGELSSGQILVAPPVLECCFIVIVILSGVALIRKGAPKHAYAVGLMVSFAMTLLAYAGWWWTEIVYDELVLNLFVAYKKLPLGR